MSLRCDLILRDATIFDGTGSARTKGDVGVTGEWANKPISLYGRNSASGTYGYFKEVAMGDGDYKDSVKEQAGSSAVVQGIASDKFAIGYVHNLSKRTALYGTYARVSNSGGAAQALNGATTAANGSSNGFDLGVRHAF